MLYPIVGKLKGPTDQRNTKAFFFAVLRGFVIHAVWAGATKAGATGLMAAEETTPVRFCQRHSSTIFFPEAEVAAIQGGAYEDDLMLHTKSQQEVFILLF